MSDARNQGRHETSRDSSNREELYRVLFEEATEGMFITDPHGRYVAVNPRGTEMTGYSCEEFLDMTITDLIPPEDLARDPIRMDELRRGRIVTNERRIRRKDGSLLTVEISARMLPEGHLLGIVHDITERKRAEAVSDQRARELAALQALGLAVSVSLSLEQVSAAALQGMLEAVQPDLAFLFLREGERLILQDVLPLEARQRLGAIPEHRVGECICGLAVLEGGPVYSRDIRSDRRCTWEECKKAGIRSFAALLMRSGEEIIGVVGLASMSERDFEAQAGFLQTLAHQVSVALTNARLYEAARRELAERERAEAAIARERNFSDDIINSLPGIFYLYDDEWKLLRWNKKHEEVTGYSPEELFGMQVLDFFSKAYKQYISSRVQSALVEGEATAEAPLLIKGGGQVPYLFTGRPTILDGKQYLLGLGVDITDRKRAEEEKNQLQAQLLQAQKMESVGRLAGGVAHDFNNMLTAILGHAELAMMGCAPSEPIHAHLKVIEKAAHRSADLIGQLLAFARKQTVAPKVLDLNDTVAGMLRMLRRLIGEDVDLVWMPAAGLWPVKMDPSQIDQLLVNLCVNARDAIAGVGKVTIETGNTAFDEAHCAVHVDFVCGEYVMLAVSDDGCGMNNEVMDHLFEPFFTTKEVGKGTGLGLATVYGIVKQNGGFIKVYSEPDNGSAFKIYLPRFAGEAVEPMGASATETPRGHGETILLVEDDVTILTLGQEMLKNLGYTVLTASTPREAVRLAEAHGGEIQLLITDVIMPEMNGRDLAELLRAVNPGLKCLFMSGYTSSVIADHGFLGEGMKFLQKPFTLHDLATRVREALE